MTVAEAVWLHLADDQDLLALLGTDPTDGTPYLFQDDLILTEEYLENSQKCAVVIAHSGEWDSPLDTNNVYFPRLEIDVYADPDRHEDHSPVSTVSAKNKTEEIIYLLNKRLHRVGPFDERWGDIRVLSANRQIRFRSRSRGAEFRGVPDGNGLMLTTLYYGLTTA